MIMGKFGFKKFWGVLFGGVMVRVGAVVLLVRIVGGWFVYSGF